MPLQTGGAGGQVPSPPEPEKPKLPEIPKALEPEPGSDFALRGFGTPRLAPPPVNELNFLEHVKLRAAQFSLASIQTAPMTSAQLIFSDLPTQRLNRVSKAIDAGWQYELQSDSFAGIPGALTNARLSALAISDPESRKQANDFLDSIQQLPLDQQNALWAMLNGRSALDLTLPNTEASVDVAATIKSLFPNAAVTIGTGNSFTQWLGDLGSALKDEWGNFERGVDILVQDPKLIAPTILSGFVKTISLPIMAVLGGAEAGLRKIGLEPVAGALGQVAEKFGIGFDAVSRSVQALGLLPWSVSQTITGQGRKPGEDWVSQMSRYVGFGAGDPKAALWNPARWVSLDEDQPITEVTFDAMGLDIEAPENQAWRRAYNDVSMFLGTLAVGEFAAAVKVARTVPLDLPPSSIPGGVLGRLYYQANASSAAGFVFDTPTGVARVVQSFFETRRGARYASDAWKIVSDTEAAGLGADVAAGRLLKAFKEMPDAMAQELSRATSLADLKRIFVNYVTSPWDAARIARVEAQIAAKQEELSRLDDGRLPTEVIKNEDGPIVFTHGTDVPYDGPPLPSKTTDGILWVAPLEKGVDPAANIYTGLIRNADGTIKDIGAATEATGRAPRVYKLHIADGEYLDMDAPMTPAQQALVQAELRRRFPDAELESLEGMTGRELETALWDAGIRGDEQTAFLRDAGFTGRAMVEHGTRVLGIFDDNAIIPTTRYMDVGPEATALRLKSEIRLLYDRLWNQRNKEPMWVWPSPTHMRTWLRRAGFDAQSRWLRAIYEDTGPSKLMDAIPKDARLKGPTDGPGWVRDNRVIAEAYMSRAGVDATTQARIIGKLGRIHTGSQLVSWAAELADALDAAILRRAGTKGVEPAALKAVTDVLRNPTERPPAVLDRVVTDAEGIGRPVRVGVLEDEQGRPLPSKPSDFPGTGIEIRFPDLERLRDTTSGLRRWAARMRKGGILRDTDSWDDFAKALGRKSVVTFMYDLPRTILQVGTTIGKGPVLVTRLAAMTLRIQGEQMLRNWARGNKPLLVNTGFLGDWIRGTRVFDFLFGRRGLFPKTQRLGDLAPEGELGMFLSETQRVPTRQRATLDLREYASDPARLLDDTEKLNTYLYNIYDNLASMRSDFLVRYLAGHTIEQTIDFLRTNPEARAWFLREMRDQLDSARTAVVPPETPTPPKPRDQMTAEEILAWDNANPTQELLNRELGAGGMFPENLGLGDLDSFEGYKPLPKDELVGYTESLASDIGEQAMQPGFLADDIAREGTEIAFSRLDEIRDGISSGRIIDSDVPSALRRPLSQDELRRPNGELYTPEEATQIESSLSDLARRAENDIVNMRAQQIDQQAMQVEGTITGIPESIAPSPEYSGQFIVRGYYETTIDGVPQVWARVEIPDQGAKFSIEAEKIQTRSIRLEGEAFPEASSAWESLRSEGGSVPPPSSDAVLGATRTSVEKWLQRLDEWIDQQVGRDPDLRRAVATGSYGVTGSTVMDALSGKTGQGFASPDYLSAVRELDAAKQGVRETLSEVMEKTETIRTRPGTPEAEAAQAWLNANHAILREFYDRIGQLEETIDTLSRVGEGARKNYIPLTNTQGVLSEIKARLANGDHQLPSSIEYDIAVERRFGDPTPWDRLDAVLDQWNNLIYKPFKAVSWADLKGTRGSLYYQILDKEVKTLVGAGWPVERALQVAQHRAALLTRDYMYDLTAKTSAQEALKNVFWFAPAWQELLQTWLIQIPSRSYWPIGFGKNIQLAKSGYALLKDSGIIDTRTIDGKPKDVIVIPGFGALVEKLTGQKLPEGEFVYGLPSGLNLATSGLPGLAPVPGEVLGRLSRKYGGAFKAISDAMLPFGLDVSWAPSNLTYWYEALTGRKPPWGTLSNQYNQANYDRAFDQAAQDAYGSMVRDGLEIPRIEDFADTNDPLTGKPALSPDAEKAYRKARDAWWAELETRTQASFRGVAFIRAIGSTIFPMSLYATNQERQDWKDFFQKTVIPAGYDPDGTYSEEQKNLIDQYIDEHPESLAYSVSYTMRGDPTKTLPWKSTGEKAYWDKLYTGELRIATPEEYFNKLAALESLQHYQDRLNAILSQPGYGTTAKQQLLNAWRVNDAIIQQRDEWERFKVLNPEVARYLDRQYEQYNKDMAAKYGVPIVSYSIRREAETLALLKRAAPFFIGAGGLRDQDYKNIVGQLSGLYSKTGIFGEPSTKRDKDKAWWYSTILVPYMEKVAPLYKRAGELAARGMNAGGIYDRIGRIQEYYGRLARESESPSGATGWPSPQEYFWGNRTEGERANDIVTWTTQPPAWLNEFQLKKVGWSTSKTSLSFLREYNRINNQFYAYLRQNPDIAVGSSEYDRLKAQREQLWREAAKRIGGDAESMLKLSLGTPIYRLQATNYSKGNKMWGYMVQEVNSIISLAEREGLSPAGSGQAILERKIRLEQIIEQLRNPRSEIYDKQFDYLWTRLSRTFNEPTEGVPLYEAILFGQYNPDFISQELLNRVYYRGGQ